MKKLAICFLTLILSAVVLPASMALANGDDGDNGGVPLNVRTLWGCDGRGDHQHVVFCAFIRGHSSGYR